MDDTARSWRVEECCLNAWPALRLTHFAGWTLRFSGGLTRRANSANALCHQPADGDAFVAAVEALYRRQRQPAIYRLTSLISGDIDRRLGARGYGAEGASLVLYRELASPQARDPAIRLLPRPSPAWLAAMAALQPHTKKEAALYRRIVRAVAIPAAFAVLCDSEAGGAAALAFAAVHRDVVCYQSVVTDPNHRRRGHACRLMETLAAWAVEHGARAACLEVEAANSPALALYDRLGFQELYRYHYRRQQA
jgi:N-acetylglutamate synthase